MRLISWTLQSGSEHVLLVKFNYLDNTHIYGYPRLWNYFEDNQIKAISIKNEFNIKFKKHYLDRLHTTTYV